MVTVTAAACARGPRRWSEPTLRCRATGKLWIGGAWDDPKKPTENGDFGAKAFEAHTATVVGDIIGDPFEIPPPPRRTR